MKFTHVSLKGIVYGIAIIYSISAHAINSAKLEQQADSSIQELYHTLNSMPNISMIDRIVWISNHFKGAPYRLGALGEGSKARYDQFPRYRVDAFDCDTYVNTVLALALANSVDMFKQCNAFNRYKNGEVSYINRNHFTSIDWNKNNQQRGVLLDITLSIHNSKHQSVAQFAKAIIDKPNWYAHKTLKVIRLFNTTSSINQNRLAELKSKGHSLGITLSKIPYIPLATLFLPNGEPDLYLFSQIPNGSVIEIVRPNWDLRSQIGTALNVSHLGFAIRIKDQLYFREASSHEGKVIDVPLIGYLKEAQNSPTIKGINIEVIVPKTPAVDECRTFIK
jgi:hypothetical protein